MKQTLIILFAIIAFTSCEKKSKDFIIAKKQVGKITDSTTVAQMKEWYKTDSIVKNTEGQGAFEPYDEYKIIDKKDKKLLMIVVPVKTGDEASLIKYVEIKSDRFHTDKGVSIASDFGTLNKNHKLGKIDESLKNIVIYVDDLNATVNMRKDVLPLNVRNDASIKIEATLIPDNAKIKDFVVFMNE